jgi:UDP-2,3-diacylglucosamine pyrophosphatase LpxH
MGSPLAYIVSDLHLGSEHFHHGEFLSWLDTLPDGVPLILNGDTIDDPRKALGPEHTDVLARVVGESRRRPVVWVYGNHDAGLVLDEPGDIRFVNHYELDRRILIVHGDDFDDVMPKHGVFKHLFKLLHKMRHRLGFQNVHVAEYAKKWAFLYRVLNERVATNALEAARSGSFAAVACGHTHSVMDVERDGVRYLNTGAWTEHPLHFIEVAEADISLRQHDSSDC